MILSPVYYRAFNFLLLDKKSKHFPGERQGLGRKKKENYEYKLDLYVAGSQLLLLSPLLYKYISFPYGATDKHEIMYGTTRIRVSYKNEANAKQNE